jgi:hypothetical protein
MSIADATAVMSANAQRRYARLAEVSKTARTTAEQAAALGVPAKTLKFLRSRARRAGYDVIPVRRKFDRSPKLAAIDVELAGESCLRCFLRGHVAANCKTIVSAAEIADFRSPSFDDLSRTGRTRPRFTE